jgi:hypothetical protein
MNHREPLVDLEVISLLSTGWGLVDAYEASRTGPGTGDTTPPAVTGISLVDPSPTNAEYVHFTVTFSEDVTGVYSSDFVAAMSGGVAGASVTDVTGIGATRTVTVSTGTGDGTLGLNVRDNNTIVDAASNPLGGAEVGDGDYTGPTDTIDTTPPTVSTMHISDLIDSTKGNKNNWAATVVITIRGEADELVSGATVDGTWTDVGTSACTTDASGQCTVTSGRLSVDTSPVIFTVSDVIDASGTYTYEPAANVQTSITIWKP